jgi:hypothetical protein
MGTVKAIASYLNAVENITMNFCGHSNFTHWIQSRHAITPREFVCGVTLEQNLDLLKASK